MTERILTLAAESFYETLNLYFEPLSRLWRWWKNRQLLSSMARVIPERLDQIVDLLDATKVKIAALSTSRLDVSPERSQPLREEIYALGERLAKIESLLQARNLERTAATPSNTIQPRQLDFLTRLEEQSRHGQLDFLARLEEQSHHREQVLRQFVDRFAETVSSASSAQMEQLQAIQALGERLEVVASRLQNGPNDMIRESYSSPERNVEILDGRFPRYSATLHNLAADLNLDRSVILVIDGLADRDEESALNIITKNYDNLFQQIALDFPATVIARSIPRERDAVEHAIAVARERMAAFRQAALGGSAVARSHEHFSDVLHLKRSLEYGEGRRFLLQASSLDEIIGDLSEFGGQSSATTATSLDRFLIYLEIASFLAHEGLGEAAAVVMTRAIRLSGLLITSSSGAGRRRP